MRPTEKLREYCSCATCMHSISSSNVAPCDRCTYTNDGKHGTIGKYHHPGPAIPTELNILEMRVEHLESILVEILNADHCKCSKFAREREHGKTDIPF